MLSILIICFFISSPDEYSKDYHGYSHIEGFRTQSYTPTFQIRDSLSQMPGWPKNIGVHAYGVALADVNGDGYLEIVLGTHESRSVYVWDYLGNELPGWPQTNFDSIYCKPAVGDVDPSYPGLEIIVVGKGGSGGPIHRLYAWHCDGTELIGWPQSVGWTGPWISPVLFDIDDDDDLEIILCQIYSTNGRVLVFNHDGTLYPGWPQSIDIAGVSTASVGDVDNDGVVEICAQGYSSLYLWDKDGNLEPGWPIVDPDRWSCVSQPVLADIDFDGDLEILHAYYYGPPVFQNYVGIYHHDGSDFANWPQEFPGGQTFTTPVVADIDHDGDLEVFGGGHMMAPLKALLARHHTGDTVAGWPVVVSTMECSPIAFDLDLDDAGNREIIIGDNSTPGHLYAFNDDGSILPDWPLPTGCALPNSPSVGDVDADGDIEIAFVAGGYVNLWTAPGVTYIPYLTEWGTWFHDNWNTGWFHPIAPDNLSASSSTLWVYLTWDANTEPDLAGYNIYRGEIANDFYSKTKLNDTLVTQTSYYDVPPSDTTVYYYCVTAQIKAGTESRLSNEVSGYTGVQEHCYSVVGIYHGATILSGPLLLPENKKCRVFDITGRVVAADKIKPGIYFIEIDGEIAHKVVKVK